MLDGTHCLRTLAWCAWSGIVLLLLALCVVMALSRHPCTAIQLKGGTKVTRIQPRRPNVDDGVRKRVRPFWPGLGALNVTLLVVAKLLTTSYVLLLVGMY